MTDRLPCCVPFCRRTTKPGKYREWICGKHWPLVPPALKLEKRQLESLLRRGWRRGKELPYVQRRAAETWERCKATAIERAGGL